MYCLQQRKCHSFIQAGTNLAKIRLKFITTKPHLHNVRGTAVYLVQCQWRNKCVVAIAADTSMAVRRKMSIFPAQIRQWTESTDATPIN